MNVITPKMDITSVGNNSTYFSKFWNILTLYTIPKNIEEIKNNDWGFNKE